MTILYRYGHEQVDFDRLMALLSPTYWFANRTPEQYRVALRHSFCVSAWDETHMVGFARLLTDFAIHAYLGDVIVDPTLRGLGIGRAMVRKLIEHECVRTCRITLHTKDAHGVYEPLGFTTQPCMIKARRSPWTTTT